MISDSAPFRHGRAGEIQRVLQQAFTDDHQYLLQGGDRVRQGWIPFQVADFTAIMTEVMAVTDGVSFLDVGSGIGTKMLVASRLFGLTTAGIEFSQDLAAVSAKRRCTPVYVGDALNWPGSYGDYDIVWMYRPFRDEELQAQLEQRVYAEMKPGAVLAGASLVQAPPGSWEIVVDDFDMGNRGAWKKP